MLKSCIFAYIIHYQKNLKMKLPISDFKIKAMKAIIRNIEGVEFGGSISLNAHGIICRQIGDIDIVVKDKAEAMQFFSLDEDDFHGYDEGSIEKRHAKKLNFMCCDVCVFVDAVAKNDSTDMQIDRIGLIAIQHPIHAIRAKEEYIAYYKRLKDAKQINRYQLEKMEKHMADVQKFYASEFYKSSIAANVSW